MQTDVYSKYQLEPERVLRARRARGRWPRRRASTRASRRAPRQTPATRTETTSRRRPSWRRRRRPSRFTPYYTMFRDAAGDGDDEFVILRPFVPFSRDDQRTELQAYMTASSDPDNYGQLDGLRRRRPTCPTARARWPTTIDSEPSITPADHAADGRRQPGALRRPAARARRRRAAVRPAVLRRRAAGRPTRHDGHRVPLRHRLPQRPGRARRVARRGARPSCSPASRAISATASAATGPEPGRNRRRIRTIRCRPRSCSPRPTSCSERPSRRCKMVRGWACTSSGSRRRQPSSIRPSPPSGRNPTSDPSCRPPSAPC